MLKPGLYEQVVNEEILKELKNFSGEKKLLESIGKGESSKILTQYVSEIIEQHLEYINKGEKPLESQIELVNKIINTVIEGLREEDRLSKNISLDGNMLLALLKEEEALAPGKKIKDFPRPISSLALSSLFTGQKHEPQLETEFNKEIRSSNRIDILVSFIKWSGLRLIMEELRDFTNRGGRLRVVTTSYMGATDTKAVLELAKLDNTEVKISYDTKRTRLHAKAYIFNRDTGFSVAYIGSSNLSNVAITSGLEWNVKIAKKDLPETMEKIEATFEDYWRSEEFETFKEENTKKLRDALKSERATKLTEIEYYFDINPYPYQEAILEELKAERELRHKSKNLIVAATGTGKTVIAGFDYKRYLRANGVSNSKLLYIAHRKEILEQSVKTFRGILRDPNFGELYVGEHKPDSFDYLFVSIQTMNTKKLWDMLPKDYYDYVVIDEIHHMPAKSYQKPLLHFEPKILLGLTATPERLDGKSVTEFFDDRIAAEIRLPEAINRKLLCPFQYFGVTDTVDLSELKWVKGSYDVHELEKVYFIDKGHGMRRVEHIVRSINKYVTDIEDVKGLGFCVSVNHAKFMEEQFNKMGIPSISITGETNTEIRNEARNKLLNREVKFIFAVDIYNEGVDIPEINTVLFLRPTESLTVFLQQLGRGLRLAEDKDCLTVLDFVGQANKRYNFEEKFEALMINTKRGVAEEIRKGFIYLPKGCFIQLEKKASEIILKNLEESFDTTKGLVSRIRTFEEDSGLPLTMENFLNYYHLTMADIYTKARRQSFYRMCVEAGIMKDFNNPLEEKITKALKRLSLIDSRRWIEFLINILPLINHIALGSLSKREQRMLNMFYVTIWRKTIKNWNDPDNTEELRMLADNKEMVDELIEIFKYNLEHIDFVDEGVNIGEMLKDEIPLDLHCKYTRDQLLVALDYMNPFSMMEGVKWLEDKKLDVFMITLNKSEKYYSETTMYNDYSINETLFHWQSQSTTSESSKTG